MSEWRTFFTSGKYLIGMGAKRRLKTFSCHISHIELLFIIVSDDPLKLHQCSLELEVYLGYELQYVKPQILLYQIWNKSTQDMLSGRSSFCID